MSETILTWNFTNWLTVVLMALVGYFLIAAIGSGARKLSGGSGAMGN